MPRSIALAASCLLALAACGDPDTNDPRGYTKAPLENPGWTVDGESPSAMSELGDPIRIPSMDTAAVDERAAPPQTAPTQTAPTQTAPTQTAPTQTAPTQTAPAQP